MAFWSDNETLLKQSFRWVIYIGRPNELRTKLPIFLAKTVDRPSFQTESKVLKYLYSHEKKFIKRLKWNPINIEFYDVAIQQVLETQESDTNIREQPAYIKKNADNELIKTKIIENTKSNISATGLINNLQKITENDFNYQQEVSKYILFDKGDNIIISNGFHIMTTQGYFTKYLLNRSGYDHNDMSKYTFKNSLIEKLVGGTAPADKVISIHELDGNGNTINIWKIHNPLIGSLTMSDLDYSSDAISTVKINVIYDYAELVNGP